MALTRWRAKRAPRPPVPPVMRTVRSGSRRRAGSASALGRPAGQARGEGGALAQGELRLGLERQGGGERLRGGLAAVRVDQQEAAGVLGLGGADQAPDRGGGRVGGLALGGGDRAAGEEGEAGLRSLGGDRLLQAWPAPRRRGPRRRSAGSSARSGVEVDRARAPPASARSGSGLLDPVEPEERVALLRRSGWPSCSAGSAGRDEAATAADRRARGVGDRQRGGSSSRPAVSRTRSSAGRCSRRPLQAKGTRSLPAGSLGEQPGVQGRVEQGRVDPEALGLRAWSGSSSTSAKSSSPRRQAALTPWKAGP